MSMFDADHLDNAALDQIALRHDKQQERSRSGFRYELMSEFGPHALRKNWILKGIIAKGETTAWVGCSSSAPLRPIDGLHEGRSSGSS